MPVGSQGTGPLKSGYILLVQYLPMLIPHHTSEQGRETGSQPAFPAPVVAGSLLKTEKRFCPETWDFWWQLGKWHTLLPYVESQNRPRDGKHGLGRAENLLISILPLSSCVTSSRSLRTSGSVS